MGVGLYALTRKRWQERYGTRGDRWEDAEPGDRCSYDMRNQPQYRGCAWSEVEPEFQRDWTQRNPATPWDRAKESVRDAWENTADR